MSSDTLISLSPTARTNRHRHMGTSGQPRGAERIADRRIEVILFTRSLLRLSGPSIELRAERLASRGTASDDDIAWWQATLALDRTLRGAGLHVEAALGARLAVQAVFTAASRSGLPVTSEVAAVARSAGEVVRLLVAGDVDLTDCLSRGWEDLLIPPGEPPGPRRPLGKRGDRARRAVSNQTRRVRYP